MKILGPERYKLNFDANRYSATCPKGTNKFSGFALRKVQKLYIVSADNKIIYVGATSQTMNNRLRYGWKAAGETGYYGYRWRHEIHEAELDIWLLETTNAEQSKIDIETIEAEIVYLVRQSGQWPRYQTEIHFHVSTDAHRELAKQISHSYVASECELLS